MVELVERVKESGTSSIGRRGKGVLVVTRVIFIECIEYVERGGGRSIRCLPDHSFPFHIRLDGFY